MMPSVDKVEEGEILENAKRYILDEKRSYLCKYLNPEDHFDFLRSKFIITRDDSENIKKETTQTSKVGKLLDILLTKGPQAYEMLVLSIQRNKTQTFLVEMLNKEFEKRKNALIALLKDKQCSIEVDLKVDVNTLPKPNRKPQKQCVESLDTSITPVDEKDLDYIWLRGSYLECQNKRSPRRNETSGRHHDKECKQHHSDV